MDDHSSRRHHEPICFDHSCSRTMKKLVSYGRLRFGSDTQSLGNERGASALSRRWIFKPFANGRPEGFIDLTLNCTSDDLIAAANQREYIALAFPSPSGQRNFMLGDSNKEFRGSDERAQEILYFDR